MTKLKKIFHIISYLQYPLLAISCIFYFPFLLSIGSEMPDWTQLNYFLITVGVALSFSTLQDTTKIQNKFSKNIWEHPKKGKVALVIISLMAFSLIAIGLWTLYFSNTFIPESISIGITVLGIGFICLLETAIDIFDYRRKDKNTGANHEEE